LNFRLARNICSYFSISKRELIAAWLALAKGNPVLSVFGPRQSDKTTWVTDHEIISYLAYSGDERGSVSGVELIGLNDIEALLNE